MEIDKKNGIVVHNTKHLHYYGFEYLHQNVVELFIDASKNIKNKEHAKEITNLCQRLNCFLGMQNIKINKISFLNSKKTSKILSEFLSFIEQGAFPDSKYRINKLINAFKCLIIEISKNNTNSLKIIDNISFNKNKLIPEQVIIFNGWMIKNGKRKIIYNLYPYYKKFGYSETNELFTEIKKHAQGIEGSSHIRNTSNFFNDFIYFICNHKSTKGEINFEVLVREHMKNFFIYADKNDLNIQNRKNDWNMLIKMIHNVFNLPNHLLFILKVGQKKSFNNHISVNQNKQIKKKLITDIPLEICDDEAIQILINKINQDIKLITEWSEYTINQFIENTNKDNKKLTAEDFGLTVKELAIKRFGKYDKITSEQLYNKNALFNRTIATALSCQLILEHPEITESFLLNCDLYDEKGNISCLKPSDTGTYLISYKPRRGLNKSEQKILLSPKAEKTINLLIEATKAMREHLKKEDNNDYRKLIIFVSNNIKPQAPHEIFEPKLPIRNTSKSIIDFLINIKKIKKEQALELSKNLSITRIRASRGVQIYLETESTTKMSQALGHAKYDPNLLEHYLPAPILDFFQRRWISIFQKGIICEAMRDSEFLLKASNFDSMKELDLFLKNHTIKNIPDNSFETEEEKTKKENLEVYISVDEEKLSVLLSINKAVELSQEKYKISPKALYWSNFAKHLLNEIENNNSHVLLREPAKKAKKKVTPEIFKEIIYVE